MQISMIAAMANNRIIGADNQMPWHLPADLKHFKAVTLGKPVVMGRKTYESIGRPLPGRQNIVISRSGFSAEGITTVNCAEAAVAAAGDVEELMIIGGGVIYDLFLSQATRLYLTFIELDVDGDTQFPDYEQTAKWSELERSTHPADERNPYNYQFVTLEKVS